MRIFLQNGLPRFWFGYWWTVRIYVSAGESFPQGSYRNPVAAYLKAWWLQVRGYKAWVERWRPSL